MISEALETLRDMAREGQAVDDTHGILHLPDHQFLITGPAGTPADVQLRWQQVHYSVDSIDEVAGFQEQLAPDCPVYVSRTDVVFVHRDETTKVETVVTCGLDTTAAWDSLGDASGKTLTGVELVRLARQSLRPRFRSPEEYNRFLDCFRSISTLAQAETKSAGSAGRANYSTSARAEIQSEAGSVAEWETLMLGADVITDKSIDSHQLVEFSLVDDPEKGTFTLQAVPDAFANARQEVQQEVQRFLLEKTGGVVLAGRCPMLDLED